MDNLWASERHYFPNTTLFTPAFHVGTKIEHVFKYPSMRACFSCVAGGRLYLKKSPVRITAHTGKKALRRASWFKSTLK
jgi:hypothetical protein